MPERKVYGKNKTQGCLPQEKSKSIKYVSGVIGGVDDHGGSRMAECGTAEKD